MRLSAGYEGSLKDVCDSCDSRYSMRDPHFDVDEKKLIATNGHAMIVIPVHVDKGETSGPVPWVAIQKWMSGERKNAKNKKVFKKNVSLFCGKRITVRDYDGIAVSYPREKSNFPKWKALLEKTPDGPATIFLNGELLSNLQKGFGSKGICMWITPGSNEIYVSDENRTGIGIVMPMRGGLSKAPTLADLEAR